MCKLCIVESSSSVDSLVQSDKDYELAGTKNYIFNISRIIHTNYVLLNTLINT